MNFLLQPQLGLSKGTKTACTLLLVAQFVAGASFMEQAQAATAPSTQTVKRANIAQTITGSVKDSDGSALAGASIRIKGGKGGATTGVDGSFKLDLPTGNETLIISMVGYKTKEVSVNGRSVVNIVLEDNTAAIDEVVVVGYGQQKKITLAGAVAQINMKNIEDIPVTNLSAVLAGQLPGVGVSGGTARPGVAGSITVRNPFLYSKDGGSLRPLYVIDGVVRSEDEFNILDQSEVENISVLKDAAAAIYGARSSQGVIVVQTKRGKAGAPKISYSTSMGISDVAMKPKMMSGYQQALWLNDFNTVGGKKATDAASPIYTQDELDYFKQNDTDWLGQAWQASTTMRHALNLSGGSDKATYFAGATYNTQDANFDGARYNKWTFRASTDIKMAKNFSMGLAISGSFGDSKKYFMKQGSENDDNDWRRLITTSPFIPTYVDGLPVLTTGTSGSVENIHFFEIQKLDNYKKEHNTGLNINSYLEYSVPFIKGLKAKAVFSKTFNNTFGKNYGTYYNLYQFSMLGTNKHIYGGTPKAYAIKNGDIIYINPTYTDSYQLNGYLTYNRDFGKHSISAIGVYEQTESSTDGVVASRDAVIVGGLDNFNYAPTGTMTAGENPAQSAFLSYLGRINYSYANKYIAEVTVRSDASTNFGPKHRWGIFPAVSLAWVISEEPFFKKNISFIDFLKIRTSAALMGTDATKPYQWQTSYNTQTSKDAVFGGNSTLVTTIAPNVTLVNPEVRWDDDAKLNFGIDANFLNNRMSFGLDAFLDHRYNMLTSLSASAPLTIGATPPSENYSIMNAFGYEISLGWNQKVNKDLSFKVNTFLSWSDNVQIKTDVSAGLKGTYLDPTGQSTDQGKLALRSLGMFRTQADVDNWMASHPGYLIYGKAPAVGMLNYEDVRGPKDATGQYTAPDGKITDEDKQYLTSKESNHYGAGLNFSVSYRNLTVSAVTGISWGGMGAIEGAARKAATATSNRPAFWADHYTTDTPDATYPAPYYSAQYDVDSDFWFRSSTTVSMRTLNISYSLPTKLANKLGFESCRVYGVGTNVFNFYKAYDYKDYGSSFDVYPTLRTISLGLNMGF